MDPWTLLLSGLVLWLIYKLFLQGGKSSAELNLPPGPRGLPLLGYAPFLKPPMFQAFTSLRDKYGDVVTIQVGSLRFILLQSYRVFKATMLDDADNFSGRLQSDYINRVSRGCGIIFVDGPRWTEHRRFSLKVLRDFGLGKSLSEDIILREAEAMIEEINTRLIDKPVDALRIFYRSVSSVICTIAFGERPGYDDAEFSEVMEKMHYIAHDSGFINLLPIIFPVLSKLVPLINKVCGKQKPVQYTEAGHDYIKGKIEAIRSRIVEGHIPTNLTEAYLMEQAKQIRINPNNHTFSDFQLMRLIFELFIAGTDTSSTALSWGMLLMSLNPDIQCKVHQKIDDTIGRARLPNLRDKKEMAYVSAVLDEISRFSSLAPNGIPHRNFREATVNGYTIPANTVVIPNIHAVHFDPDVWEYPDRFYPEHFLTKSGEYAMREELVTFGVGKRSCLGEGLARSEFFLFFVTLLQNYNVSLDNAEALDTKALLVGTDGTVRAPGDHKIIFSKRDDI